MRSEGIEMGRKEGKLRQRGGCLRGKRKRGGGGIWESKGPGHSEHLAHFPLRNFCCCFGINFTLLIKHIST